jgi:hypothetical protein
LWLRSPRNTRPMPRMWNRDEYLIFRGISRNRAEDGPALSIIASWFCNFCVLPFAFCTSLSCPSPAIESSLLLTPRR